MKLLLTIVGLILMNGVYFNSFANDNSIIKHGNNNSSANPAKIESFKSYHYNTSQVYLEWNVTLENENSFFVIERSLDGENFNTVGEVKVTGNAAKKRLFEFVDEHPKIGENFYRLKQIDSKGFSELSEINKIEIVKVVDDFMIHPNPATHNFDVSFLAFKQGLVGVKIYNEKGQPIKDFFLLSEEGFNNFQVDVTDLENGNYIVHLSDFQSEPLIEKVIKE